MARKKKPSRKKKTVFGPQARFNLPAPKNVEIANALSSAQRFNQRKEPHKGVELCLHAIAVEPNCAQCFLVLAECYECDSQVEKANEAFQTAQKLFPNFVPGIVNHGLMLYSNGFLELGLSKFQSAIALDGNFLPALQGALNALTDLRRYNEAIDIAEKIWRVRNSAADQLELARLNDLAGNAKAATKTYLRAKAATFIPGLIDARLGLIELFGGHSQTARNYFKDALRDEKSDTYPFLYLSRDKNADIAPADLEQLVQENLDRPISNYRAPLQFALAHTLDRAKEYGKAFESFQIANDLICSVVKDDSEQRHKTSQAIQEAFAQLQDNEIAGDKSDVPVFVTGLPRSGTTLIEQIISSHSMAGGLGELELIPHLAPSVTPSIPKSLRAAGASYKKAFPLHLRDNKRLVDKSISSVQYIGLILSMFPNAKIIYCDRHPMDTAWSAYKEYFNEGALAYTYGFERIAKHQTLYAQLIDFWQEKFPDQILRVRYEDIVQNPEKFSKQIIDHIDLPWQNECLDFHKTKNAVRTASVGQVRQPVYTSSIGRWKPYAAFLDELHGLLSGLIEKYER